MVSTLQRNDWNTGAQGVSLGEPWAGLHCFWIIDESIEEKGSVWLTDRQGPQHSPPGCCVGGRHLCRMNEKAAGGPGERERAGRQAALRGRRAGRLHARAPAGDARRRQAALLLQRIHLCNPEGCYVQSGDLLCRAMIICSVLIGSEYWYSLGSEETRIAH